MIDPVNPFPPPRRAAGADTEAVIALFRAFLAEIALDPVAPPLAGYVRRAVDDELSRLDEHYLAHPRQGFWVVDAVEGTAASVSPLAGTVGLQRVDGKTAELRRMIVARNHRRKGLGHALLGHVERFARAQGYDTLMLETSSLQPAAIALYRRAGYTLESTATNTTESAKAVAGIERLHFSRSLGR